MPRALISEDRIELGNINPLIGGDLADTLRQVGAAVAFIGHGADHAALLDAGSLGASPAACRGEALLCACIDVALRFEVAELSVVEVKATMTSTGGSHDTVVVRTILEDGNHVTQA